LIETLLFAASMLAAVQADVDKCTALEEDSARLACYDAIFRPPAGRAVTEATAPTAVSGRADVATAVPAAAAPPAAAPSAERAAAPRAMVPPSGAAHEAAPAASAVTGAAVAGTAPTEDTFGLTEEQRAERAKVETLDEISAMIVGIEPSRVGKPVLVLDNGQRWKQLEATVLPVFSEGETVAIRRATFGSYLASVVESGRSAVRVRRLD